MTVSEVLDIMLMQVDGGTLVDKFRDVYGDIDLPVLYDDYVCSVLDDLPKHTIIVDVYNNVCDDIDNKHGIWVKVDDIHQVKNTLQGF
jgi:hypothetical protein